MSARIESLKRLYKGMAEHARQLSADTLKRRYAPKPVAPVAAPAVPTPSISDDDMGDFAAGLE